MRVSLDTVLFEKQMDNLVNYSIGFIDGVNSGKTLFLNNLIRLSPFGVKYNSTDSESFWSCSYVRELNKSFIVRLNCANIKKFKFNCNIIPFASWVSESFEAAA